MPQTRTWPFVALMLIYAAGVSLYVGYSMSNTLTSAADPIPMIALFALITFAWLLASGVGFALIVALLNLVTRRPQQFMAALALGLAVGATYQAVVQIAFEQSYTYWKQHMSRDETAALGGEHDQR